MGAHHGLIEGVDNAPQIRDLIMSRLKHSRTTGLGDESPGDVLRPSPRWSQAHLDTLKEIRDIARRLAS
jgi:hypothetical protein